MTRAKNYAYQETKTYNLGGDAEPGQRQEILLLEDERELASQLKEILELSAYGVTLVSNGAEGLQHILKQDFDAIVCDMIMPGFPGDMFYLAVQRARPDLCRRFVFTTGHRADPKIDEFIRSVRGLMLWKPFQPHELVEAIQAVIRKAADSADDVAS